MRGRVILAIRCPRGAVYLWGFPATNGTDDYAPFAMAAELRPLGLGEKLDAAFSLYRRNFLTLIAIVAIIVIPFELLTAVLSSNSEIFDPATEEFQSGAVLMSLALVVLGFVANTLATGSATKAIADDYLGETPDWQDSIKYGFSRLWPLVLGSILFGIGIFIGLILLIIPGIILWVSWSIWVPAVIVEDLSATGALGRSNQLVKGRRWPVFGYFIVVYVIVWLVSALAAGLLGALILGGAEGSAYTAANAVINIVLALFTTPFVVAATVVLYFDERVRKEAFDVAHLAAQIHAETPPLGFEADDPPSSPFDES